MESMFEVKCIMALDLDQDPQSGLKNKMDKCDEADLQKAYSRAQGKDDEIVTIANISRQIGRKLQPRTKIDYPPGLNIAPSKEPSITSVIIQ